VTIDNDDHYVPDANNAHLDTTEFKRELHKLLDTGHGTGLEKSEPWQQIHNVVEETIKAPPDEPDDYQLICRYLSPTKFLWFVSQMTVYFGSASRFEDSRDSTIPADYSNCVLAVLAKRGIDPVAWNDQVRRVQSRWLVSCWTKVDDHHDDNLLWHKYAGGEFGVGITFRYEFLRNLLRERAKDSPELEGFFAGYVSYESPLRIAPFNKRRIFRNEKEIRFVYRANRPTHIEVDVTDFKSDIGLRLSPETPAAHRDAIINIWRQLGGDEDRIHIAGE
jgi:hypothetical protein